MSVALSSLDRVRVSMVQNTLHVNLNWRQVMHRNFITNPVYMHTIFQPLDAVDYQRLYETFDLRRQFTIYGHEGEPNQFTFARFDGLANKTTSPQTLIRERVKVVDSQLYRMDESLDLYYLIDKTVRTIEFSGNAPVDSSRVYTFAGHGLWMYESNGVVVVGTLQMEPNFINSNRVIRSNDDDPTPRVHFIMRYSVTESANLWSDLQLSKFQEEYELIAADDPRKAWIGFDI